MKNNKPTSAVDEITQEEDARCLEELNRVASKMPNNITIAEQCLRELYALMMFREGLPSEGKAIEIINKVLEKAADIAADYDSDAYEAILAAKTKK